MFTLKYNKYKNSNIITIKLKRAVHEVDREKCTMLVLCQLKINLHSYLQHTLVSVFCRV